MTIFQKMARNNEHISSVRPASDALRICQNCLVCMRANRHYRIGALFKGRGVCWALGLLPQAVAGLEQPAHSQCIRRLKHAWQVFSFLVLFQF
jgi:hypothetical protein